MTKKLIDESKKRNANINLKVTRKEKKAIDEVVKKLGIPVASAIRNVALSQVRQININVQKSEALDEKDELT